MGIFDRLEYDFETTGNSIFELSSNTQSFMNTVPSLLTDWQQQDIANSNVGGYFRNPVSNVSQNIRSSCGGLITLLSSQPSTNTNAVTGTTSEITTLFGTIISQSSNIAGNNGLFFVEHTNRISGVTPLGASPETGLDTALLPHYETAVSTGQLMMYLTNQSDNISNNSPIMGSFTSILIENELNNWYSNVSTYYTTISNSITVTGGGTDANTDPFIRTSNLTLQTVQTMSNTIIDINNTMAQRRNHDEKFYTNSRQVVDEYSQLRIFNNTGATATNLLQNYIGSDKLLTRLNS
jgi:hypothetical protein